MDVIDSSNVDLYHRLDAWIDARRSEIVSTTQALLRIPSVKGLPQPLAPFGIETSHAIDYVLTVASSYGLTTKNVGGYAGHAEYSEAGSNAPLVGVLAHVDVVPAGDGWSTPPFAAEIVNDAIVARGVIDDKGPAIASLFALIALKECGCKVSKRIRLIVGADEESGFGCVAHYFQNEEMPEIGFTPDAEFPLVYAEKGIANIVLTSDMFSAGERLHICSLHGGLRPNMVPDTAECILEIRQGSLAATKARLNSVIGITVEQVDDIRIRVQARGVSAHGSTPELGVNAVVLLCEALMLLDHSDAQGQIVNDIFKWGQDTSGKSLGIAGSDIVAGPLTCNLGVASIAAGIAELTFNIRYPVTWSAAKINTMLSSSIADSSFSISTVTDQAPLHVPLDDPLVATLLDVYRAETGDHRPAVTMGGGTYARAMQKGVAFGPAFPGSTTPGPHHSNEAWKVNDLIKATKIYAKALARLSE